MNDNTIANVDITGYKEPFHTDPVTSAGGAAIYVSESLKALPRKDIKFGMDLVESCWVEIEGKNNTKIMIGCIYRHPNANLPNFTTELQEILLKLNEQKYQSYIMGDFNIDFLKYNTHAQTEEYLDMLFLNNFQPLITKPTRITENTKTLIDHIYTNDTSNDIIPGIAIFDISDHLPVYCLTQAQVNENKERYYYRDYSNFNEKEYQKELSDINWNELISNCKDLHGVTAAVLEQITIIANKHAPIKMMSRRQSKLHVKPWITKGMLKSIKTKQKLYHTHFSSNDSEKKAKYKKYSNKINKILKQAKHDYYNKQFQQIKNNLKQTWKLIGTIIQRKNKKQVHIPKIIKDGKAYTNDKDICNKLNEHFTDVGPNLAKEIGQINDTCINPTDYIPHPVSSSLQLNPVSFQEVINLFKHLDETKSSLGIPNKLIKIVADDLAIPFTYIYNESLKSGIVPDPLKISRITPIYKSDSPFDPNNYRPIATLSSFGKVLEKIVHDQLLSFLDDKNILCSHQFGFRKGHSTEKAILEITDKIKTNIDKKTNYLWLIPRFL